MRQDYYGKGMLVADLAAVTLWGVVLGRQCTPLLMAMVPVRVALAFGMYRGSRWTLVAAIGFVIAYSCSGCVCTPFESMLRYLLFAVGEPGMWGQLSEPAFEVEREAWVVAISALGYLWLAVLPLVRGLLLHGISRIRWGTPWISVYLVLVSGLCVWVMADEGLVGGYLLGMMVAVLPALYWCVYERRGRSPIQVLLDEPEVRWYLLFLAFMLAAFTIGLKDVYSLKLIGLAVLPPLFYVMLATCCSLGKVLTRCCVALGVVGPLYWLMLEHGKTASLLLLVVALVLIVYAGVTVGVTTNRWVVASLIMIVVPMVIVPFTLGLNPYVVLEAEHTRMYASNLSVRQGVYVVERYAELAPKGTPYYWCRKRGLRDRYGLILPMEYDELKVLDGWGRYIAVSRPLRYGSPRSEQRYGIFDLRERRFVVNPEHIAVSGMERIDDRSYRLINPEGRPFATLYLWDSSRPAYYHSAHIEPLPKNRQ